MTEITKEDIKDVVVKLDQKFSQELFARTQDQLEEYWHFKYDFGMSIEKNIYAFWKLLNLYQVFCRRWEEHHNGTCCVVERVRDTYLMPKINQFALDLRVAQV